MIKTKLLETRYNPRQALIMLLHTDPEIEITDIEDVYYPYLMMRYEMAVGKDRSFMKKLVKYADCIVDRVSGTVYDTVYDKDSEKVPSYVEVEIPKEEALDIEISLDECHQKGHDFALRQYIEKAKLLFTPKMKIIMEEEFYKKFYVVTCKDQEGRIYFVMVDAVDGGISILDHEQHIDTLVKLGEYEELQRIATAEGVLEAPEAGEEELLLEEGQVIEAYAALQIEDDALESNDNSVVK